MKLRIFSNSFKDKVSDFFRDWTLLEKAFSKEGIDAYLHVALINCKFDSTLKATVELNEEVGKFSYGIYNLNEVKFPPMNLNARHLSLLTDLSSPEEDEFIFIIDDDVKISKDGPEVFKNIALMIKKGMTSGKDYIRYHSESKEEECNIGWITTCSGLLVRKTTYSFKLIPAELLDKDYLFEDLIIVTNALLHRVNPNNDNPAIQYYTKEYWYNEGLRSNKPENNRNRYNNGRGPAIKTLEWIERNVGGDLSKFKDGKTLNQELIDALMVIYSNKFGLKFKGK